MKFGVGEHDEYWRPRHFSHLESDGITVSFYPDGLSSHTAMYNLVAPIENVSTTKPNALN